MADDPARRFVSGMLLPELVAARGLAAVWVVIAHTCATVLQGHRAVPEAIEYTRIIVDFFFVLSGFVLAHMYDPAWREGRFKLGDFLLRRFSRLWPLHLVTLLAMLVLVLAGRALGVEPENPHTWWTFFATLTMIHSAWATTDLAWNWPSWSVSAEWIAYMVLPIYFAAADKVSGTARRIVVCLGLFVLCSLLSHAVMALDLVTLTFDGGAARLVPSFLTGILLRRIFDDEPWLIRMTPRVYAGVVAAVFAICVALIAVHAPYDALWPPMVVLVAALASRATWSAPGLMRSPTLVWLGDLSYSIYLNHAIVLTVLFTAAERLGFAETLPERVLLGLLVAPLTLVASIVTYRVVEIGGRRLVMGLAERAAKTSAPRKGGFPT